MENFLEVCELLAHVPADSETSEVNTGYIFAGNHHEYVVLISVGDVAASGTFDVDIEEADDSSGTNLGTVSGKSITQLAAADDDKAIFISLKGEDFSDDDKQYFRVEATPATAATEFAIFVFGYRPRFAPVGVTNWHETK